MVQTPGINIGSKKWAAWPTSITLFVCVEIERLMEIGTCRQPVINEFLYQSN